MNKTQCFIFGVPNSISLLRRFLEYGEYKRHLYGTSIESVTAVLQSGKICIVDMEPQVRFCGTFTFICLCVRLPQREQKYKKLSRYLVGRVTT